MAHERTRARRVLARLRSMTPRVLRRLLVVGGLVLAGWLLGTSGQAHADAGHGLVAGTTKVTKVAAAAAGPAVAAGPTTVAGGDAARAAGAPVTSLVHGGSGGRRSAPPPIRPGGLVRGVAVAERAGDLIPRPGAIDPVLTLPVHDVGSGLAHTPRHSLVAPPGERTAAASHAVEHESGAAYRGAARSATFGADAPGSGRCGRAHARTAPATPAPPAGFPHQTAGDTGALPTAGPTPAGGLAGHPTRPVVAPRPSAALTSVVGAVPPAVHTATDEPAISPD